MQKYYIYPNRLMCDCLEEARKLLKAGHHESIMRCMPGIIEEIQVYGNRMESALQDKDDIRRAYDELKRLKKEIRKLEAERDNLKKDDEE